MSANEWNAPMLCRPAPGRQTPIASLHEQQETRLSRKPRKLLVVRLPLLDIRVPPLLRLLGHVIEERRVAGEIEQADLAVAVGVHRKLHRSERHRRKLEHLAT